MRIGDTLHAKQVQASAPGRITLISANEAYAPIELAREEVEVIGRVVWKGGGGYEAFFLLRNNRLPHPYLFHHRA